MKNYLILLTVTLLFSSCYKKEDPKHTNYGYLQNNTEVPVKIVPYYMGMPIDSLIAEIDPGNRFRIGESREWGDGPSGGLNSNYYISDSTLFIFNGLDTVVHTSINIHTDRVKHYPFSDRQNNYYSIYSYPINEKEAPGTYAIVHLITEAHYDYAKE